MPSIEFRGGPLHGETWTMPELTAGGTLTYKTETQHCLYRFSGLYRDKARLYYCDGMPTREPSPWPNGRTGLVP